MAKKAQEHKCKNCQIYNMKDRHCMVLVLFEGEKIYPPTEPEDHCIFEEEYENTDESGKVERWKPEIQEVKLWVEDPKTGEKCTDGVVKIAYPPGFFGKETD